LAKVLSLEFRDNSNDKGIRRDALDLIASARTRQKDSYPVQHTIYYRTGRAFFKALDRRNAATSAAYARFSNYVNHRVALQEASAYVEACPCSWDDASEQEMVGTSKGKQHQEDTKNSKQKIT
jgi:hypothetical protein